jgi:hypothetical protein
MAKTDLRPNLVELRVPEAPLPVGKLSVTVSTKLDDQMAFRWSQRAQLCGMTEAQLFRIILDRADAIFESWDRRVNPRYFVEQLILNDGQLKLFSPSADGNLRSKR